jgi:hypothetical protein
MIYDGYNYRKLGVVILSMKLLLIVMLMLGAINSAATKPIDVVVPEFLLHYKPYLYRDEGGVISGNVINILVCAFGDQPLSFRAAPTKRARHDVLANSADMMAPIMRAAEAFEGLTDTPVYSDTIHEAYLTLVSREEDSNLTDFKSIDEPVRIGFVLGSHARIRVFSSLYRYSEPVHAKSIEHLFKLLVTGRIQVAIIADIWGGDGYQIYEGRRLKGRTIDTFQAAGLFSSRFSSENKAVVESFNNRLPGCWRDLGQDIANPYLLKAYH